MQLTKICW